MNEIRYIALYRNTITQSYSMSEQGTSYGFGPYQNSTIEMDDGKTMIDNRYYDGHSDGVTHVLELDPGVEVYWNQGMSVTFALTGTRHFWDQGQMIHNHSKGGPAIIDSRFGRTYSIEEHEGPAPVSLYSLLEPMPV